MATKELMTLQETADYLRMSRQWVSYRTNTIPNYKLGNKRLFRKEEVDQWMEAYRKGSPLTLL